MDLFNIPQDTGMPWRFHQLIDYIADFPDEIGPIARSFLKNHNATNDDKVWWVLLYSTCYCMGTSFLLYEDLDFRTLTSEYLADWWKKKKPNLIFQSDRRYIKNMNQFTIILEEFLKKSNRKPYEYIKGCLTNDPFTTYDNLYKEVQTWRYYGRFSIILFIFNLCKVFPEIKIDTKDYDWKNGATTTSAIFNLVYKDEEAKAFDAKELTLTPEDIEYLDSLMRVIIQELKRKAPERSWNVAYVASDLCSYRKLFKGSRYPGFYVDRQQEEILWLQKNNPEYKPIWDFVWESRKEHIKPEYLGELHGWSGIRKYHNHRFIESGQITPPQD